jgi:hypothetical protein
MTTTPVGYRGTVTAEASGKMLTQACLFMGVTKGRFSSMLGYPYRHHASRAFNGHVSASPKYALRALHLMTLKAQAIAMRGVAPAEVVEERERFIEEFHLHAAEYWERIGL